MLATRDLAPLPAHRADGTRVVRRPGMLVELLREHGFAPVLEGQDGGVVLAGPEQRRARPRRRIAPPTTSPVDEASTTALVAGLRAAEATADERRAEEASRPGPAIPTTDPVVTLALLQEALADGHGVWIGVTDRLGATAAPDPPPAGRRWTGPRDRRVRAGGSWSVHRIVGATLDTPPYVNRVNRIRALVV